jgi:hypothetical protein
MSAAGDYFSELCESFGDGWNRFWFRPSDPAPLCLIRIAAGLVTLYLLATYTPDLETFFGPNGLETPELLASLQAEPGRFDRQSVVHQIRDSLPKQFGFSYLNFLDTPGLRKAGHFAGLTVLAMFTAGLFTRVTSVMSLLVLLSYVHGGPLLTAQVEPILAFVLLYLCLGPAGADWSLDRWLARRRHGAAPVALQAAYSSPAAAPTRRSSAATISIRLIQVHLALVYAMMAIGKVSSDVWWSGSAMWWLMAKTESRLVDFTWLHGARVAVDALTNAVMLYQIAFPILIWNRLARPLLLGLGVVVWGLLALVTGMVPFALALLIASVAFVSAETVRSVLPRCCE